MEETSGRREVVSTGATPQVELYGNTGEFFLWWCGSDVTRRANATRCLAFNLLEAI